MDKICLDNNGLSYFWSKIKTYIDNVITTFTNSYLPFGTSVNLEGNIIDLTFGDVFLKTITADTTFTFRGVPAGRTATFSIILTNGGQYTITWPSSVKWSYNSAPLLTSSGIDVLTFLTPDGGTTWYGSLSSCDAS